ncbi:hypothetical protein [Methanothermobacter sp. K4]|uniref:hypothetical protein n=1 Tax=Methanothermobacter sp. K4 TaxID=2913262 RepID=UPI001ED9C7ED|nr:hypothetical protein [Methanothermobacter sp. K4]MCG2828431.1 hypothetical protein [Methanothermobacter sp. K4]
MIRDFGDDEGGFIFTTDAVLALIVVFIFTASIVTYFALPNYMGSDHQHLEALAADALDVMRQDGTLYSAAAMYSRNNTAGAENVIRSELRSLLPPGVGYEFKMGPYPTLRNDSGILVARDTASRAIVISGPEEGWLGRAWYKMEEVTLEDQEINFTTTVWNFHNWLTNFWNTLYSRPYWGYQTAPQNITFSVPSTNIHWGKFLLGSCNRQNRSSYGANVVINNVPHVVRNDSFTFLNLRPGTTRELMYNYQGNITSLVGGSNRFYVQFTNMTTTGSTDYDLPWFSVIANYTNTIKVPKGIITRTYPFNDVAGLAVPGLTRLDNNGTMGYGRIYDLNTGTVTNLNTRRVIAWSSMVRQNHLYSDGLPFVIDSVNGGSADGCAVSVTQDVPIPTGSRILDAYTVVNPYGGVDNALVEVWNGTAWNVAFCSFNYGGVTYSAVSDGYGNVPGIIYIRDYLRAGQTNKVRVTIWDNVPGQDYDLVGLVDCYSTVSYTSLPIQWNNYPFASYQNSTNVSAPVRQFAIGSDAKKVLLFMGAGLDTKTIRVEVKNSTSAWTQLYNGPVPFSLDIGAIDVAGSRIFTTGGTPGNYSTRPGTYDIRVTINSGQGWESGDSNAEIYSGTRVAVIYPKFLANMWATEYSNDAYTAQALARQELIAMLQASGYNIDPSLIRTEALYTGDIPNSLPVRLTLWRS